MCGVILAVVFIFSGGSEYLMDFSDKTEEASIKLEGYERDIRQSAEEIKTRLAGTVEAVEAAGVKVKTTIDETRNTITDVARKAKEISKNLEARAEELEEVASMTAI
ncbi:MAG: hypothetical protein KAS88_01815 [Deltaproteobacteria bacterium]|nr:hypothetical protein [Deltaproteobacteria bacterium]